MFRLMLRKEFPAVFCRFVFLKDRPCAGVLYRGRFQFPVGIHGVLRLLYPVREDVKTVCCLGGLFLQFPVFRQAVILQIGECGGHLF